MENILFKYIFRWSDSRKITYNIELDAISLDIINSQAIKGTDWTKLDYKQCPDCTLDIENNPHCPLALKLVDINILFANLASYEEMYVEVTTPERTISKNTTVQQAISSLMGLIMPGSGCPHTRYFKPMARFHLPFATEQETIYRASSMYLLAQYFINKDNKEPDLELKKLNNIYSTLHDVNTHCAQRLRHASLNDSTVNAVVLLDMFAKTLPYAIDESLEELRYLFKTFIDSAD